MREQSVYAAERFDRLLLIDLVVEFSIFLWNGEHPGSGDRLDRRRSCGVAQVQAKHGVVHQIKACQGQEQAGKPAPTDLFRLHVANLAKQSALLFDFDRRADLVGRAEPLVVGIFDGEADMDAAAAEM